MWRVCTAKAQAHLFRTFAAEAGFKPADRDFPRWIAWAALALTALPIMNCLQRGQVDVLKLYLLLLGIRLSITGPTWRAWAAGGVAMAAAMVLKVTPALPVAFVLFVLACRLLFARSTVGDRHRAKCTFGGVAAGGMLFVLLVPAMLVGWQANLGYLDRFYHDKLTKANDHFESDKTGNTRSYRNQSFSNAVIRLGDFFGYEFLGGPDDRLIDREWRNAPPMVMDDPGVGNVLLVARAAAVALLLLAGFLAVKRGDALGQAAAIGLACTGHSSYRPSAAGTTTPSCYRAALLLPLWLLSQNMKRSRLVDGMGAGRAGDGSLSGPAHHGSTGPVGNRHGHLVRNGIDDDRRRRSPRDACRQACASPQGQTPTAPRRIRASGSLTDGLGLPDVGHCLRSGRHHLHEAVERAHQAAHFALDVRPLRTQPDPAHARFTRIPVGVAYAVWSGLGTALIAVIAHFRLRRVALPDQGCLPGADHLGRGRPQHVRRRPLEFASTVRHVH